MLRDIGDDGTTSKYAAIEGSYSARRGLGLSEADCDDTRHFKVVQDGVCDGAELCSLFTDILLNVE